MAIRNTQASRVTIAEGDPDVRITQTSRVTIAEGDPDVRITQAARIVIADAADVLIPEAGAVDAAAFEDGPADAALTPVSLGETEDGLGIEDGQASAGVTQIHEVAAPGESAGFADGPAIAAITRIAAADAAETLGVADGLAGGLAGSFFGDRPLLLVRAALDTGEEFVSDIPVHHPAWDYKPGVLAWGNLRRELAIPPNYTIIGAGQFEIADSPHVDTYDQEWRRILHLVTQRRRRVTIKSGFEGGRESLAPVLYAGEFTAADFPPDRVTLRFGDIWRQALDRPIPGLINRANFPNLPPGIDSGFFPLVFGRCASPADNPQGVIPLQLVDTSTNDYAANQTVTAGILAVYRKLPSEAVFTLVSPAEYSLAAEERVFGPVTQTLTYVRMHAAQEEGAELRADIDGMGFSGAFGPIPETAGTIRNIVHQIIGLTYLMFVLDPIVPDFDYEEWRASWQYFETAGLFHDGAITTPMTFRAALAQMLFSGQLHLYQNRHGKLALTFPLSNANRRVYTEHNDILASAGLNGSRSAIDITSFQPETTINQFKYKFAPNHATNEWGGSDVFDNAADQAELGLIEDEEFTLPFIYEPATAAWAIRELARYYDLRAYRVQFSLNAPHNVSTLELARFVGLTYYGGIGGPWTNKEVLITGLEYMPAELRYVVDARILPKFEPPMADAAINGSWARNSRVGPFYADGNVFGCFVDDRYLGRNRLAVVAWDAAGQAFIPQDDGSFPALANGIGSFDTHRAGNTLFIATQESGTGRVAYHEFSIGRRRWTVIDEQVQSGNSHGDASVSVTRREPSGELLVNYAGARMFIASAATWWNSADGDYTRAKFKRRIAAGVWSAEVDIGNPEDASPSFAYTSEHYGGRVHVGVGRAIADNANRVQFVYKRLEPLDVASNGDFQVQTLNADNSLGLNTEFQLALGMGYSAAHPIGDYAAFDDGGSFKIAAPAKFGGGPKLYVWPAGSDPAAYVPLSSVLIVAEHAFVAAMPAIAVKYFEGELHTLSALYAGGVMRMVYKTLASPYNAADPPYDAAPMDHQAGPEFAGFGLQMVAMDLARVGGRLLLFTFYSEGGPAHFRAFDVAADILNDE